MFNAIARGTPRAAEWIRTGGPERMKILLFYVRREKKVKNPKEISDDVRFRALVGFLFVFTSATAACRCDQKFLRVAIVWRRWFQFVTPVLHTCYEYTHIYILCVYICILHGLYLHCANGFFRHIFFCSCPRNRPKLRCIRA